MDRKIPAGIVLAGLIALAGGSGCTSSKMTHTARTGIEQLLVSNAVDQALDKSDFQALEGQKVFVDDKYLDCVDKSYILGSVRHRALLAGANLVAKAEDADILLEIRSGGVGTDSKDSFLGMPQIAIPGPMPLTIPEVRLLSRTSQTGTAKLALVAYDAKSRDVLGTGGVSIAKSEDNNWFLLGLGPYQNGSVRSELRHSAPLRGYPQASPVPHQVAFGRRAETIGESAPVRLTGADDTPASNESR